MIVVRVKVSRGIEPFSPMGIDSADTSQPPNGGDSHGQFTSTVLSNNPARQYYRYTSVPIDNLNTNFVTIINYCDEVLHFHTRGNHYHTLR
jgi:hypothetical protein